MVRHTTRLAGLVALALVIGHGSAWAGPPLLCHPFDIAGAASLPWDGANGWSHGRADYDVRTLAADTGKLLTPSTPIVVRMETLRRAALYATRDAAVARQVLDLLNERARRGAGSADNALALFDAGYYVETMRQIGMLGGESAYRTIAPLFREAVAGLDGFALVKKSSSMRTNEPAIEFAAALIASSVERASYAQHAAKARQGAAADTLLARNIQQIAN